MPVVIAIIKWIFIVAALLLALIFALCVLILALALFPAIRFAGDINYDDDAQNKFNAKIKVNLVFGIIKLKYENNGGFNAKIFFYNITEKKSKNKTEEKAEEKAEEKVEEKVEEKTEEKQENVIEETAEEEIKKEIKEEIQKNKKSKTEGIKQKAEEILEKVNKVKDYPDRDIIIKYTLKLLEDEIKAFKFKRFRLEGELGFDDPSTTGYALAAIGIIRGATGLNISVAGNFEAKKISIGGTAAGKTSIWALLYPFIRWVLRKPIWKLIKPFIFKKRKEDEK